MNDYQFKIVKKHFMNLTRFALAASRTSPGCTFTISDSDVCSFNCRCNSKAHHLRKGDNGRCEISFLPRHVKPASVFNSFLIGFYRI